MVFAVTDTDGEVLGLFRMPDATIFSIDVAVAKARNVAYYADPSQLQPIDQVPGVPPGRASPTAPSATWPSRASPRASTATRRARSRSSTTAASTRDRPDSRPAAAGLGVPERQGFDAFNPQTNFHDPINVANQNGIVFFPGSAPLYKTRRTAALLVGGLGVSGDGVDQDDVVTLLPPPRLLRRPDVSAADKSSSGRPAAVPEVQPQSRRAEHRLTHASQLVPRVRLEENES